MKITDIEELECPECEGAGCVECDGPTHRCGEGCRHDSDCSVHNEPAYRNGPCDCTKLLSEETLEALATAIIQAKDYQQRCLSLRPSDVLKSWVLEMFPKELR